MNEATTTLTRAEALQGLHRTRSLWMGTRTSRINALRGFCREFGLVIP
jgi:transposase